MNPPGDKNLKIRNGLPVHLQKLAKVYPREVWENHENFNELTRFWLSRHAMFREIITRLKRDSSNILELGTHDNQSSQFRATTARLTGFLLNQLHEHHTIEDHHYFPMLKPFDADFDSGFQLLENDHQELDRYIHELTRQTEKLIYAINSAEDVLKMADETLRSQTGFEKFLDRHLQDEEDLVIPIILKYGGPELVL